MAEPCCPICGKKLGAGAQPASLPFCSRRCKLVDLGNWLGGSYVVAGPALGSDDELGELDPETVERLLRDPS